jgi:hypothetical protein
VAGPTIRIVIDAVADGLERAAKKAGDTVDKLGTKLGKSNDKTEEATGFFGRLGGAARGAASDGLGPLGDAAGALGVDLDGMSTKGLVAGAALTALGTAAVASVKQFMELAGRVRDFANTAGVGTEDASRLIAVMDDLGVSTDSGASAIGRLARNIDAGKLGEYNIAIGRTKDGTVDMAATLANVADAIANTTDPTKRATMGNDLLGKSYAELLPLLNLGADGIREWTSEVSGAQVLTEENVAAAQQLSLALDGLAESGSDLGLALGQTLTPLLAQTANDISKLTGVVTGASDTESDFGKTLQTVALIVFPAYQRAVINSRKNMQDLERQVKATADKQETAAEAAKAHAEAEKQLQREMRQATDAAKAQVDALDKLRKADDDLIDAALDFSGAQLAQQRAGRDWQKSLVELTEGTGEYEDRVADVVDQAETYIAKSWAIEEVQRRLAGETATAGDKADYFRDMMSELAAEVSDPTVRAKLEEVIGVIAGVRDRSNEAAGRVEALRRQIQLIGLQDLLGSYAEFGLEPPPDVVDAQRPGRAAGGPVMAGKAYTVGEVGPELFVPQSNGRILSADDLARVGNGGGQGVTIVVNSPIGKPDDVVRWLREELRRLDRGQR